VQGRRLAVATGSRVFYNPQTYRDSVSLFKDPISVLTPYAQTCEAAGIMCFQTIGDDVLAYRCVNRGLVSKKPWQTAQGGNRMTLAVSRVVCASLDTAAVEQG
jgi:hypothetical protein